MMQLNERGCQSLLLLFVCSLLLLLLLLLLFVVVALGGYVINRLWGIWVALPGEIILQSNEGNSSRSSSATNSNQLKACTRDCVILPKAYLQRV